MSDQKPATFDLAHLKEVARGASSPEEVVDIARSEGFGLSLDNARVFFDSLQHEPSEGELADEELDDVAGGCGGSGGSTDPRVCPYCGSSNTVAAGMEKRGSGYTYFYRTCKACLRRYSYL